MYNSFPTLLTFNIEMQCSLVQVWGGKENLPASSC